MPTAAPEAQPAAGDSFEWPYEAERADVSLEEKLKFVVERQIERSLIQHHEVLLAQVRSLVALATECDRQELEDQTPKTTRAFPTELHGMRKSKVIKVKCTATPESSSSVEASQKDDQPIPEVRFQADSTEDKSRKSSCVSKRETATHRSKIGFVSKSLSSVVSIIEKGQQSKHEKIIDYIDPEGGRAGTVTSLLTSGRSLSSLSPGRSPSSPAPMHAAGEPIPKNCLRSFLSSPLFEISMGFLVFSNAAFLGWEVNYLATNPHEVSVPEYFRVVSYCYTGVFVVELILRLISDRSGFLCESDSGQLGWNYLDMFIVLSSLVEVGLDLGSSGSIGASGGVSASNIQTIQLIRVFRLLRLIRLARFVRFIKTLRLMVHSILHTLTHVVGAMVLLTVIMYIFAILFTSATTSYKTSRLINDDTRVIPDLEDRWGSIDMSMLSLFMSISAGINWGEIVVPLSRLGGTWTYLFLVYISFTYFAVLNVVTGVFCQAAVQSSNEDQDAMMQTFMRHKQIYTERFVDLFKNIDADDSGVITIYEFVDQMYDEDVRNFFASLGLESTDALCIFDLLEDAESEGVKIEEFVMGCLRLKGSARSSDMLKLLHEHRLLTEQIGKITDHFKLTAMRRTRTHGLIQNDLLV